MSCMRKCSATYGRNVQSSNRVGSPWCCARLSQFHAESPGTALRCAYFLKFRSRCPSCCAYGPPRRESDVLMSAAAFCIPRKAYCDRNRPIAGCHERAYSRSFSSFHVLTRYTATPAKIPRGGAGGGGGNGALESQAT